jgi:hypothetical protein
MALTTTDITTGIIRTALSESNNDVFQLCTSTAINKWSRYKPVTGTWPAGTTGMYGLNLPTNWNHVDITSNARMGDFREYDHTAIPTMHSLTTEQDTNTMNAMSAPNNRWKIRAYNVAATYPYYITPDLLSMQSYYFGIKISGAGTYTAYKTHDQVSSIAYTGVDLDVYATYDPDEAFYTDLPFGSGTYTWELFIASTQTTASPGCPIGWSTSAPSNYIALPHEGLYSSTGTFTVEDFIYVDDPDLVWDYYEWNSGVEILVVVGTSDSIVVDTIPSWITIKDWFGDAVSETTQLNNGDTIRIYPNVANGGVEKDADVVLKNIAGTITTNINVVHNAIRPPDTAPDWVGINQAGTQDPFDLSSDIVTGADSYVWTIRPIWSGGVWVNGDTIDDNVPANRVTISYASPTGATYDPVAWYGITANDCDQQIFYADSAGANAGGTGPFTVTEASDPYEA